MFHGCSQRRPRQGFPKCFLDFARIPRVGLQGAENGSGTVAGAALILMASALLTVAAGAGHGVIRHAQARSTADLAALSAAIAWRNAREEPCDVAVAVANANGASLISCHTEGEYAGDVLVNVAVGTGLPVMPRITVSARAGPTACH
ncbi:Rv3654c family TadE-like protein [Bifidobacterium pongonis]|nr:Rv3654c family TadE-like protein [Bifidobacterium pongonis]